MFRKRRKQSVPLLMLTLLLLLGGSAGCGITRDGGKNTGPAVQENVSDAEQEGETAQAAKNDGLTADETSSSDDPGGPNGAMSENGQSGSNGVSSDDSQSEPNGAMSENGQSESNGTLSGDGLRTDLAGQDTESSEADRSKLPGLDEEKVVYSREEVCTLERVNIRKTPSTDGEVLRVASRRETFIRTANDGTWSAVELEGDEYYIASEYLALASEIEDNGRLVVIDAGHQASGNSEQEPVGPGASETKAKVASGTRGVSTGLAEYELTLAVSLKLRDELESRGYQVLMIRESNDVNISNAQRAQTANSAGADAFIRVHANGSDDSSQHGILTICQTAGNPYNGDLYETCRRLSDCVLDGAVNATGASKQSVWETDSMSGINWCRVPVTIVEMGFMTNPTEDENMALDSYQNQLAVGIADGIDEYFRGQ